MCACMHACTYIVKCSSFGFEQFSALFYLTVDVKGTECFM